MRAFVRSCVRACVRSCVRALVRACVFVAQYHASHPLNKCFVNFLYPYAKAQLEAKRSKDDFTKVDSIVVAVSEHIFFHCTLQWKEQGICHNFVRACVRLYMTRGTASKSCGDMLCSHVK